MARIALIDSKLKGATICAVEVVLKENNTREINAIILNRKKSSLETSLSKTKITAVEELKGIVESNCPITLAIGGKGIIHKKVAFAVNDTNSSLLQKVLPNADPKQFYIQRTINKNTSSSSCYVSVIRKDIADALFEEFKNNKLQVISCSLSPFIVASVVPLIEEGTKEFFELNFSNNKIIFHSGEIYQLKAEENGQSQPPIQVGEDYIKSELLTAFASGFSYLVSPAEIVSIDIPIVRKNEEEFHQQKIFRLAGWAVLIFYFTILLANYLAFDNYWNKKNELSTLVTLNQGELEKLESLKKEYGEKQKFLNKAGLLQASKTSYYADQIAMDMPDQILLTALNINPIERKVHATEEEGYSFNTQTVDIKGTCSKSAYVNEWINILKKKSWISQVSLINFNQDKELGVGIFTIELKLK